MKLDIYRVDMFKQMELSNKQILDYSLIGEIYGYPIYSGNDYWFDSKLNTFKKFKDHKGLFILHGNILWKICHDTQEKRKQILEDKLFPKSDIEKYLLSLTEAERLKTIAKLKQEKADNLKRLEEIRINEEKKKADKLQSAIELHNKIKSEIAGIEFCIIGDDVRMLVNEGIIKIPLHLSKALNNLAALKGNNSFLERVSSRGRTSWKSLQSIFDILTK